MGTEYENNEERDKDEREVLIEATKDLRRIIKELERNAYRLEVKIDEIRKNRIEDA